MRAWRIPVVFLALLASCTPEAEQVASDVSVAAPEADDVRAVADSVLLAISTRDPGLLRRMMLPDARIVATGPGREPRATTVDQMAESVASPPQAFDERMWSPTVEVDGDIASVWAPYDFYRDGEFSHCGVDAFHLLRVGGRWRVQNLIYSTAQPPACALHPDGPPA